MFDLILITIWLIIFLVLSIKRRDWALYLLLACLPLYVVRFNLGSIPMTLLEAMIVVLAIVCFIVELKEKTLVKSSKELYRKLRASGFFWPTLLMIVAATIAMGVAPEFREAAGIWKAYFIEVIVVFLVFLSVVKSRDWLEKVFWSLGVSGSAIGLFAIFQYITGLGIPESYLYPEIRSTALFGYPAAAALFLAPIFVLFFGLLLKDRNFRAKRATWLIVLILAYGLFTTGAEGAWLAVVAAIFVILIFTKYRLWVILGTSLLIIAVFAIPQSRDYILPVITFQDTSGDVRLVLWEGTTKMIADRPILGAGLAGFQELYIDYKEAKHTEFLVYPHNLILNFWVETGMLGVMAIIWLIIEFLRGVIKLINKKEAMAFALLGVLVCFLVYGLVDVPYFKNDLSVLFWIWVGSIIVLLSLKDERAGRRKTP